MRIVFNDIYESDLTTFRDNIQNNGTAIIQDISIDLNYCEQDKAMYRDLINNNIILNKIVIMDNNDITFSIISNNGYTVERLTHNIYSGKNSLNVILKLNKNTDTDANNTENE